MACDANSELWKDVSDSDAPEVIRNALTDWQQLCDGDILPKRQTSEDRVDSGN